MTSEQDLIKQLLLDAADQAGPLDASLDGVTARIRRRRRVRIGTVGLAVGCITAGAVITIQIAVGSSSHSTDSTVSGQPTGVPTALNCVATMPPSSQTFGDTRSCQYVGLTLEAARAQAAAEHRDLRIVSQDGVNYSTTYEFRTSRVSVAVVNDRVTSAFIG
ncbi:hypothetical protein ABTX85_03870 [Streptomyces sp. NPDC096097]|uniref:hypothetical protein n=1 Tax=Streptomyces sp. NPDC096097 TaxID=3155546 RepID=UPI0033306CD8